MDIRKNIIIILVTISLLAVAFLITINVTLFKEISYVPLEPKEKPVAKEEVELNYAIPSTSVPTGQATEVTISEIIEKRKALQEEELKAERDRSERRSRAFARQKELEVSLLNAEAQEPKRTTIPSTIKEDVESPTTEELKALEDKGIISF